MSAASLIMLAGGVPFIHAGSELLRSKSMDRNSYDSGDWYNEIDWTGATSKWNELQYGKAGGPGLKTRVIPPEFHVWPGSPRDPGVGDPLVTFRYDQAIEFVNAIREQRSCSVTFHDGARAQAVMDAAVRSAETRQWVDL